MLHGGRARVACDQGLLIQHCKGVVAFIDASGFTQLTERLAVSPHGAEMLRCAPAPSRGQRVLCRKVWRRSRSTLVDSAWDAHAAASGGCHLVRPTIRASQQSGCTLGLCSSMLPVWKQRLRPAGFQELLRKCWFDCCGFSCTSCWAPGDAARAAGASTCS